MEAPGYKSAIKEKWSQEKRQIEARCTFGRGEPNHGCDHNSNGRETIFGGFSSRSESFHRRGHVITRRGEESYGRGEIPYSEGNFVF
ncbi:hypothetical protein CsatB_017276 [Cannabis sativa]